MKSVRSFSENALRLTTFIWFLTHFTLTALYVMPLTPAKAAMQPILNVAIGTIFSQNWSLFAPNPAASNQALLVRCVGEGEIVSEKNLPSDNWHDLSMPLWQRLQQNRFTAYDRMARPQYGLIRRYVEGHADLEPWRVSCLKGSGESCKFLEEQMEVSKKEAGKQLSKIGSAFCREAFPSQSFNRVALRARETVTVPWSERYSKKPESVDVELGLYPLDTTVALMGIYK